MRDATPKEVDDLRDAVRNGRPFKGAGHAPTFKAEVIRDLVLGDKADSGVQIEGVKIDDLLDLRNARGVSGGACNALILVDCVLKGEKHKSSVIDLGIDASHSHLQRLSLINCRTDGVELSSAVIDGDLELDELGPRKGGDNGRACWVKARGLRIGGSLTARKAKLSLPWVQDATWPPVDAPSWSAIRAPFGLDLQGAQIGGSLILEPEFDSKGGVNIAGARLGGDLLVRGADLWPAGVGGDSIEAIYGYSVEVLGHALLGCHPAFIINKDEDGYGELLPRGRFNARGTLDFRSAKIGGWVALSGARVTSSKEPALSFYSATLSYDLRIDRDDFAGEQCEIATIELNSATVGGELLIQGHGSDIAATGLRVARDLTLLGSHSKIDLSGSVITGDLKLGINGSLPLALDAPAKDGPPELMLVGASVGRVLWVQAPITIPAEGPRPRVDLRGMRVASLSDGGGESWGLSGDVEHRRRLQLVLDGFEYERIDGPDGSVGGIEKRRRWLSAQYASGVPTKDEYRPQPYRQLAKVWRTAGYFDQANAVTQEQLRLEKIELRSRVSRLPWKFAEYFFGFFLDGWRAFKSFIAYLFLGVAIVFLLAEAGALKVDASAVGTVVASQGGTDRVVIEAQPIEQPRQEIPCGNHINELVYPLDVMLPLIDLREESRCRLSIEGGWFRIVDWTLLKSAYAVVGWIMLTGLIVTLSGVVRRRVEA